MKVLSIKKWLFILFVAGIVAGFTSCKEDEMATESMYTFLGETVGQYVSEDESLSDFATILRRGNAMGLLKTYGTYTCFAPTNDALQAYYTKKGKKSLDDFTDEELQTIAYDHIINGYLITRSLMKEGRLGQLTMSDRYVSVSYLDNAIYLNDDSKLLGTVESNLNEGPIHNGTIHIISQVLDPSRFGVVEAISQDERFSLFYEALVTTNLSDSLMRDIDREYDPYLYTDLIVTPQESNPSWSYDDIPWTRKYGYTVFMESNKTFSKHGIETLEDLKKYAAGVYDEMYPEDKDITDVTDRRNSLNRFVAYHLINKELSVNKLIDAYDNGNVLKTVDMYEWIETMCPNTLIEIKKDRQAGKTNIINYITLTGQYLELGASTDNDALNGVYHEINDMLVYDKYVFDEHSTKRLRFDFACFFPEITNNNLRGRSTVKPFPLFKFPRGYLDNLEASEQTTMGYISNNERLMDYQGDELFISVSAGSFYDFSIRTYPVPPGTYEVRIGYLATPWRGVCQYYFDGVPRGVPVNLNNSGTHVSIGWELPGSNPSDPFGYENDKMMRNQGYMKGLASILQPLGNANLTGRTDPGNLRKILGTFTFDKAEPHTIALKGLSSGEMEIDYIEFIPVSAIEFEGIY
ncbi:MAG: fasciclin domain-containing protein [Marinilabiliaceae bacterium]|nr:fasciclin domain-containing protein [Marinilabiliaceae bacterium]MBN2819109.1 fasciclin domain-containing protein [Bacteroidales bacterium]